MEESPVSDQIKVVKLAAVTVTALLLLGLAVVIAYKYSQSRQGGIVLPGGVTYLGTTPTVPPTIGPSPTPSIPRFTTNPSVPYKEFFGVKFPYVFSYPETLPLLVFVDDPLDSVAVSWDNIPPQENILLNVEIISDRDKTGTYKNEKDFVENWWRFFTGLKGLSSLEPFTNLNGLKGYQARYLNLSDQAPNVDVFFEIPNRPDIMIHLASGILDESVFNRITDSVKWNAPTPTL